MEKPQLVVCSKPFLPKELAEVKERLALILDQLGCKSQMVLYKTQIAAFINRNFTGNMLTHNTKKTAFYNGVIDAAVISDKVDGYLMLAIVIDEHEEANQVKDFLKAFDIPMINRVEDIRYPTIKKMLASSREATAEKKKVGNLSEFRLRRITEKSLFCLHSIEDDWRYKLARELEDIGAAKFIEESYRTAQTSRRHNCYNEVAFSAFLRKDLIEDSPSLRIVGNRRADVVVSAEMRLSQAHENTVEMPVLVVEFDGPGHEDLQQKRKDSERDELLLCADLPVIRVKPREYDLSFLQRDDPYEFITSLIRDIVLFSENSISVFMRRTKGMEKAARKAVEHIRNTKIERGVTLLSPEEEKSIYHHFQEIWYDRYDPDYNPKVRLTEAISEIEEGTTFGKPRYCEGFTDEELRDHLSRFEPSACYRYESLGFSTGKIEYLDSHIHGYQASTLLTDEQGKSNQFETEPIRVEFKEPPSYDGVGPYFIKLALRRVLERQIDEHIIRKKGFELFL